MQGGSFHHACQTASVSQLKSFLSDRGVDAGQCVEKTELVELAVPLLRELATTASTEPSPRPAARSSQHRLPSVAAGPAAATAARRWQQHSTASRTVAANSSTVATGSLCKLCRAAVRPVDKCVRMEIPSAGRRPQPVICHAACVKCCHEGCSHQSAAATTSQLCFRDGKLYCQAHLEWHFLPKCTQCDEPISGPCVTALKGQKFHQHCFVCASCRQPLERSYSVGPDNLPYCQKDHKKLFAPRCSGCAVPMTSWVERSAGAAGGEAIKLCRRCSTDAAVCFSCHALQTPSASSSASELIDLPDGRMHCPSCASTAVANPQLAAELLVQIRAFFSERYGLKSLQQSSGGAGGGQSAAFGELKVQLCDRSSMSALCRESGSFHHDRCPLGVTLSSISQQKWRATSSAEPTSASTSSVTRQHVPNKAAVNVTSTGNTRAATTSAAHQMVSQTFEVRGIAALISMPRLQLGAVLAHELCHAFMHLFQFPSLPPLVAEGICELWSSLWLEATATAGDPEATARLQLLERNRDPVYGDGLRQAKACWTEFKASHKSQAQLPDFMKMVKKHCGFHQR